MLNTRPKKPTNKPSKSDNVKLWKPTRDFLRFIETNALLLREKAKVGPLERLDPYRLAKELGVRIVSLDDLNGLSTEDYARLSTSKPQKWSGMGIPMPDGRPLVILNPNQTQERANVTVMEEVCHAHFGHRPSRLVKNIEGMVARCEYDVLSEREAYWTAGAALLPSHAVANAIWNGILAQELASKFGASVELAEMRIKTLGLWSEYIKVRERRNNV